MKTDEPFCFDVRHSANVVLCCQYKLVVQNPLRLVIQTGGWMQLYYLIVLHSQIMTSPLKMCHLHQYSGSMLALQKWHPIYYVGFSFSDTNTYHRTPCPAMPRVTWLMTVSSSPTPTSHKCVLPTLTRCQSDMQQFWRQDLCQLRTTSLEQSAAQSQTIWVIIRPVQDNFHLDGEAAVQCELFLTVPYRIFFYLIFWIQCFETVGGVPWRASRL